MAWRICQLRVRSGIRIRLSSTLISCSAAHPVIKHSIVLYSHSIYAVQPRLLEC
jgi:hypothetical protein